MQCPPVMILCGGKGTRLREHGETIPKGLVEIGGMPILWHIMKIYAHFGFKRFVLCLGYKGDMIKEYFWPNNSRTGILNGQGSDETITYQDGSDEWTITFAETGLETNTGGRLKRASVHVREATLFATYGDGLADIDIGGLLSFHSRKSRLATMTCVKPRSPFGIVLLDSDDQAIAFHEKPRMNDWVNGGFFVFQQEFFDHVGEDDVLEREPFERLVKQKQISAYRFEGFWRCMDTYKDAQELNELWETGEHPWKVW